MKKISLSKSYLGCINCKDENTATNQPKGTTGITDLKLTVSNPWFVRMDISTALHEAIHTVCTFCVGCR